MLQAAVAVRDITPPPGIRMWGYADRPGNAAGTLDPLYAKTLILSDGARKAAIIVLDLGRVPMPDLTARIRSRAAEHGVDEVIMAATHTHGGPAVELSDRPHVAHIAHAIIEAIAEAAGNLEPVRLGRGRVDIDISHNRRVIKNGECCMLWRNAERLLTSPLDHEALLLTLERENGEPLAHLINYACHPVVLGGDNLEYSADWCGEMCRLIKEDTGAECLFLQGGAGDINPYLDKTPLDEGGIASMRETGTEAAKAVIPALRSISCSPVEDATLVYHEAMVRVGTRWDFSQPAVRQVFEDMYGDMFLPYASVLTDDLAVPLGVLTIGSAHAFAFFPGEFFVQAQLDLKANSPVADPFFCGYALDFHLYFPTVAAAAQGGYGGSVATYVGAGASGTLVHEAALTIGKQAGLLRPEPRPADFTLRDC